LALERDYEGTSRKRSRENNRLQSESKSYAEEGVARWGRGARDAPKGPLAEGEEKAPPSLVLRKKSPSKKKGGMDVLPGRAYDEGSWRPDSKKKTPKKKRRAAEEISVSIKRKIVAIGLQ